MRTLILFIIALVGVPALAAPKRFDITNRVNGNKFVVDREDGQLGTIQPEWGKPAHEKPCSDVIKGEEPLITARRTVDGIELCSIADYFQITAIDMSSEIAAEKAKMEASESLKAKLKSTADIDKMKLEQLALLVKEMRDVMVAAGLLEATEQTNPEVRTTRNATAEALNRLELESKR